MELCVEVCGMCLLWGSIVNLAGVLAPIKGKRGGKCEEVGRAECVRQGSPLRGHSTRVIREADLSKQGSG